MLAYPAERGRFAKRQFRCCQIKKDTDSSHKPDPPVEYQQDNDKSYRVEKSTQYRHQDTSRRVLYITQSCCDNGGNIPDTILVEVAHRDVAQPISDVDTLFRHHAIAGFRLLHRGKIGRDDTPNEGNGHNSQRNADKLSVPVVRY